MRKVGVVRMSTCERGEKVVEAVEEDCILVYTHSCLHNHNHNLLLETENHMPDLVDAL